MIAEHLRVARHKIRALEGCDIEDVSEYIDRTTDKYKKMVGRIVRDLTLTTLRYQTVDDMVEAIGLPKEKLCLYCWTGVCPQSKRPGKNLPQEKETLKTRI